MEKILLLILLSTSNMNSSRGLFSINEYINSMEIDIQYTEEKIRLAKKITPLMPIEYINPINRSIYITESLVKILELKDYTSRSINPIQATHIPIEDNKERINRIVSVIQKEVPKSNINKIGSILELVTNIDKYKKMFEIINTFTKNQNLSKDTNKLLKMVEPMMKGKEDTDGEGSLDIEKIMNIISVLNKSKEKSDKNQDIPQNTQNKNESKTIIAKLDLKEDNNHKELKIFEETENPNEKEMPNEI